MSGITKMIGMARGFLLLAALTLACQGATDPPLDSGLAYVPGATWRAARPQAAGLAGDRMSRLATDVARGRYGTIDALIIVRYGYVVHEQYVGWPPARAHTLQSVTKSVTSLLFGIMAGDSSDVVVSRFVLDAFPQYDSVANTDQRKHALRLIHLLTMRTGMDFWEQPYPGSPLDQLNRSSGDWIKFILDRPMTAAPDSLWAYNSGAPILLCGVIRQQTGEAVDAFAQRELFTPLGIMSATWYRSPYDRLPHCGGGLSLTPLDLARIGYLVLRRGRWGDTQVVPEAWIDRSTQLVSTGPELFFASRNSGYGYLWWLFPQQSGGTDHTVITGSGSGGQWLFVIPSLDLVIAVAASNGDGLGLLYDGVLPAVRE